MKGIAIAVLVLAAMLTIVAVRAAQDTKRVGVIGAVIGCLTSVVVLTGVYVAARHILG